MFFKKKNKTENKSEKKSESSKAPVNNDEVKLPLHRDDVEFKTSAERNEFTQKIGDNFVSFRQLDLTDEELKLLSVTDGEEMIRLEQWAMRNLFTTTPELEKKINERQDKIYKSIIEKLFKLDEIYVVYSKTTGCPYLFSGTYKSEENFITVPPNIRIITKANAKVTAETIEEGSDFELRMISNGSDGNGIHNFLGECFYMNGACGIELGSFLCRIDKGLLVPPPDFSNVPEISRPVMNPDVMRWSLLLAQLGRPENEEEELNFKCFYNHLCQALKTAKFLMPMKRGEGFPNPTDTSETIKLEKDASFGIITMPGKNGKQAVHLYTDWKRLYENLGEDEGWGGVIQSIESIISVFDCAINPDKKYQRRGFYIDQEMFERIK